MVSFTTTRISLAGKAYFSRTSYGQPTLMVTCDQNIQYQQNLAGRRLSIVVLSWNFWPNIKVQAGDVAAAVSRARPGSFELVEIAPKSRRHRSLTSE